jgi:hypothetical protein
LHARVYKIPEPILIPLSICSTDSNLLIYKEKENQLFSIFSLPDCSYLGSFGERGQGPNDFGVLDPRSFQSTETGFKVLELGSAILKTVAFEDNKLSVVHSEKMIQSPELSNGFYPLSDSVYLTFGEIAKQNEFTLFNKKSKTVTEKGSYPQWGASEIMEPSQLFFTYLKVCVVHPGGQKFAAFYSRFKRLRIYDSSVTLLHDINVQIEPCSTNFEVEMNKRPIYYIGRPQAIGDYIYALCANSEGYGPEISGSYELQVWDWDGNPTACYQFDRRVSVLTISEKHNKIYALDMFNDDELYVYDLPKLKK